MASRKLKTSWVKINKYVLENGKHRIVAGRTQDRWSYLVYENGKILKNFFELTEAKEFVNELT